MAVTKISVQQLSNELFKIVGRNYLFVDKAKVTLDGTETTLTSNDFLNAEGVIPTWKEINHSAIAFVVDGDVVLTIGKITSLDETNNEIKIVADASDSGAMDALKAHTDNKNNPHEVKGSQVGFTPTDTTWAVTDVAGALDDLKDSKQDELTFDTTPTQNSTNPVTSGGVYTEINNHVTNKNNPHEVKADQVDFTSTDTTWTVTKVDAALDDLHTNKQDSLTFDSTPTAGSTNPVTSGGIKTALDGKIDSTEKGANNGVAELDATGKVPSSQLPSFVDDVIEGYYNTTDSKFYEESTFTTEITGEAGKIYVSLDDNKTYRWSGSAFVEISSSLVLGETSTTAYRGDRGKTAYDHSQLTSGNPHNVAADEVGFTATDTTWTVTKVSEALDSLKTDLKAVDTSVKSKISNATLSTDGTKTSFTVTINNKVGDMVVGYFNGIRIFEGEDFTATRIDDTSMTIVTNFDEPATASDKVYIEVIK